MKAEGVRTIGRAGLHATGERQWGGVDSWQLVIFNCVVDGVMGRVVAGGWWSGMPSDYTSQFE